MNRSSVPMTWLTALAVAVILILTPAFAGQAQPNAAAGSKAAAKGENIREDDLNTLLEAVKTNFGKIRTLKTRLIQKKHLALFSAPVASTGELLFKSPDKIRLEFFDPFQSLLMVSGKKVAKFEAFNGEWKQIPQGNTEVMRAVLDQISAWIRGEFNRDNLYRVSGQYRHSGAQRAFSIVLEPRDETFKKFIRAFELGVNADMTQLNYIIIRESEKDYTRIDFHHSRINPALDDDRFDENLLPPLPQ